MSKVIKSNRARLALTYLLIIMTMSLAFSYVLYRIGIGELRDRRPPVVAGQTFVMNRQNRQIYISPDLGDYLDQRFMQGREKIIKNLILLNVFTAVAGSAVSYLLARKSLEPIEKSIDAQNRFISDASHELRTPITVLQTTNEIALRENGDKNSMRLVIESNVEEAKKLKDLANNLLDLAKQTEGDLRLQKTEISVVVSEAINQLEALAKDKKISIIDDTKKGEVLADPKLLTQSLIIIIDNALKYSPEKSDVLIKSAVSAKYVALSVTDKGIGIGPEDVNRIFDRFYRVSKSRTKDEVEGHGLGLSIAKLNIEKMGGEIEVKSTPKKGSTFTIRLLKSKN